jgi:hypothetical protein
MATTLLMRARIARVAMTTEADEVVLAASMEKDVASAEDGVEGGRIAVVEVVDEVFEVEAITALVAADTN